MADDDSRHKPKGLKSKKKEKERARKASPTSIARPNTPAAHQTGLGNHRLQAGRDVAVKEEVERRVVWLAPPGKFWVLASKSVVACVF